MGLAGETDCFPLLHSHRIRKHREPATEIDLEGHERYIRYWGGNPNISRYITERATADHEHVLFLEFVPHVLHPWLKENPNQAAPIFELLLEVIALLKSRGAIHFDAHFHSRSTRPSVNLHRTDFKTCARDPLNAGLLHESPSNHRKDTPFPSEELARLLRDSNIIAE